MLPGSTRFAQVRRLASAGVLVALSVAPCAAQRDNSGIRVVHSTPDQFCRGTARSIAVDRYDMKRDGTPLEEALAQNQGVAVIEAITRAVYASGVDSEGQAADAGTAACRRYFG